MSINAGLYIVATPIGNLGDLSPRARDILAGVDLIAAEDTRHSGRLLAHFGISTPRVSLHEHNESERTKELIARLGERQSIALIADAGTPLISDPGMPLVREARAAGVPVYAVPGPCALVAGLSVSGIATDRFVFEGFLPPRPAARRKRLAELVAEPRTLVFYESPHRIAATFEDMIAVFGPNRPACTARELTKMHETVINGTLAELGEIVAAERRGEWVVLLSGNPAPSARHEMELERVIDVLLAELPLKQAVALATKLTATPRNDIYKMALARQSR